MTGGGGERNIVGFVELGKEFPDLSVELEDLYVSKGGGNFTHGLLC